MRPIYLVVLLLSTGWSATPVEIPGAAWAQGLALNECGAVTGTFAYRGGLTRVFRWEDGVAEDLGTLGGNTGRGMDINDDGVVVGYSAPPTGLRACIGDLYLEELDLNPGVSYAMGITNDLRVVGSLRQDAFLIRSDGTLEYFLDWMDWSRAYGISETGWICGTYSHGGYVRSPDGALTDLGTDAVPWAVNDSGMAVGWLMDERSSRAFLWDPELSDAEFWRYRLEVLAPTLSAAYGLNDRGDVVGMAGGAAVLWQDREPVDLSAEAGVFLRTATDVNNQRTILANTPKGVPYVLRTY